MDKQLGPWYLAFNPALERSFHGPSVKEGVGFSPNFKAAYSATKKLAVGLEYRGSLGSITGFDPFYLKQEQIVPAIDYDLGPNWEFNFGVGVGVTQYGSFTGQDDYWTPFPLYRASTCRACFGLVQSALTPPDRNAFTG